MARRRLPIGLAMLTACGAPQVAHDPVTPAVVTAAPPSPAPVPDPPAIEALTKPGDLFMLVVNDHGKARCQRWAVEPDQHRMISIERDGSHVATTTQPFHVSGHQIVLDPGEVTSDDGGSASCPERTIEASETEDAIVADRARWFRTASGCAAAIARHARVAEEECVIDRSDAGDSPTSRRKFEAMLKHGGTMYSIAAGPKGDFCQTVSLKPYTREPVQGSIGGDMSYPIVESGIHGIETLGYEMVLGADTVTLLGPGQVMEPDPVDSFSFGYLCGGENAVQFFADRIELQGALYFTAARCRTVVAETRAKASWLPEDPPEEEQVASTPEELKDKRLRAHDIAGPAIGGC